MKRMAFLVAIALVLAPALALTGADQQTLTGEYYWTHADDRGALEAIFTATGENAWDVAFHFTFQGQRHLYEGTASGSLTQGDLEGTVKNENKRRTFTFAGTVEDGAFSGTHAELRRGQEQRTGTLTLSR